MKKFFIIYVLLAIIGLRANAQTTIPGGNVYGTWTFAGSPYLVQGDIIVPNDSTLNIDPGVVVEFQGHYKLFCNGRILALGTVGDSITFTVPTANISTGWFGMRYDSTPSTNDTSRFMYCDIQHGLANGSGHDAYGGAFFFYKFSKCVINHCNIANNRAMEGGGAIYCSYSSPIIENNTFNHHYSGQGGFGIDCENSSNVKIINNIFINGGSIYFENSSLTIINNIISGDTLEGGISCWNATSVISKNIIKFNTNQNGGGGGGILLFNSSATITDNIISNNTALYCCDGGGGGISCYSQFGSTNVIINNNVISNNYSNHCGGGIYCTESSPTITNNTISNDSSSSDGGGLYCVNTSNPVVENTIFYGSIAGSGNGNNITLEDNASCATPFTYCDIQGGLAAIYTNGNPYIGTYTNNIKANPLFVSPSGGTGINFNGVTANWSLQAGSPCINAGNPSGTYPATDIAGNPRMVNGMIDIGAYEHLGNAGIININLQNQILVYPNPANGVVTIDFQGYTEKDKSTIELYNITGGLIKTQVIQSALTQVNISDLAEGVYIVKVRNDDGVAVKRVVKE